MCILLLYWNRQQTSKRLGGKAKKRIWFKLLIVFNIMFHSGKKCPSPKMKEERNDDLPIAECG
jgi:hypothetical protein